MRDIIEGFHCERRGQSSHQAEAAPDNRVSAGHGMAAEHSLRNVQTFLAPDVLPASENGVPESGKRSVNIDGEQRQAFRRSFARRRW